MTRAGVVRVLGLVGSGISVFILPVACFHLLTTRKTAREVQQIAQNVTTRYIGEFPADSFLEEIVAILREANGQILIACDFPAYGMFSDPNQHLDYRSELELKSTKLSIKMVVLDTPQRSRLLETYYPDSLPLDKLNRSSLETLRKRHPPIASITDVREAIGSDQDEVWKEFSGRRLEQRENRNPMPLYVWIVDERAAVFVIAPFGDQKQEKGFLTRDLRLIQQLEKVFDSYWKVSLGPAPSLPP